MVKDMKDEKDFLWQVLTADNVTESVCANLDTLLKVVPEISPMIGFEHKNLNHHLDVWQHTLCALGLSKKEFDVRLILLLHDIGKPFSYQEENGTRHFKNHQEKSAQIARVILKRLDYKNEYINYICKIIARHDIPLTKYEITSNPSLSSVVFEVQKCDALAHNPAKNAKRLKYIDQTTKLFNETQIF